ncbi:AzlD domain-containing protein [Alkalilacustris brevis]|uniref:AzlD domain-containing protein n=1 Tax=Alkalilacustris brevis TaxID=2026338 RepID=UPI000E0DDA5E|nr:AzlD domain-containing protein [Alkalilacustris brevis]
MSALAEFFGPYWPYMLVVLVGFLPSEIWRLAATVLARRVSDSSEVFVWVQAVATALIAAVVVKLLMQPPAALAAVPLWGRAGAVATGMAVWFLLRRSLMAGVAAGTLAIVGQAAWHGV